MNHQKMIQLLRTILCCPVCSNKYSSDQTSIIEGGDTEKEDNSSILVHTDCQQCKSSVVFSIILNGSEIFSIGMMTDLTGRDAQNVHNKNPISLDEVMDFHEFCLTFDRDFKKIIE